MPWHSNNSFRICCERAGLPSRPCRRRKRPTCRLADQEQLRPIFPRLAAWGVKRVHLIAGDEPQGDDLVHAARQAVQLGMHVGVRGRASDLAAGKLLTDLAAAGVQEIEIPFLSAIGEVHDALAGAGDYRSALRAMDALANLKLPLAAQIVLVPSTWKTIERTLQLLDDRGLREVRIFAIACRDDEPSSWAISASELVAAARWFEQSSRGSFQLHLVSAAEFDPWQTLAQQVRRGPRAAADAVRDRIRRPRDSAHRSGGFRRQHASGGLEADRPQRGISGLEAAAGGGRALCRVSGAGGLCGGMFARRGKLGPRARVSNLTV